MLSPIRILYVDDYELDRKLVLGVLKNCGDPGAFQVTEAASREEFQKKLMEPDFDLVLTDFNILGYQGLDVLEACRSLSPRIPVIIITGTGSEEVAVEAMKRGAADYIIKSPSNIKRLPHVIRKVLENHYLELESQRLKKERDFLFQLSVDLFCVAKDDGFFQQINPAWTKTLGWTADELLGKPWIEFVYQEDREATLMAINQGKASRTFSSWENRFRCRDGTYRDLSWNAVHAPTENLIFAVARDVTRDIEVRKEREQLIAELRNMVREVHHRVRNNLQVMISLLNLQVGRENDTKVIETVREIQGRLRAIAMIHEALHRLDSLRKIDLGRYLDTLIRAILDSLPSGQIKVKLETAEGIALTVDQAMPFGLVVNELITNAVKYAFPQGRAGQITVRVGTSGPGRLILTISDNGVGLPPHLDWRKTDTLGLSLVRTIVEIQLQGSIEVTVGEGTTFEMMVDLPDRSGRLKDE